MNKLARITAFEYIKTFASEAACEHSDFVRDRDNYNEISDHDLCKEMEFVVKIINEQINKLK